MKIFIFFKKLSPNIRYNKIIIYLFKYFFIKLKYSFFLLFLLDIMGKYTKYIITFFTEFLILFLGIIVYKIVNERFNNTQFTEYNLFRRSSSLFQPLIMCGLGVSIPKFTSKYLNRNCRLFYTFYCSKFVWSCFFNFS